MSYLIFCKELMGHGGWIETWKSLTNPLPHSLSLYIYINLEIKRLWRWEVAATPLHSTPRYNTQTYLCACLKRLNALPKKKNTITCHIHNLERIYQVKIKALSTYWKWDNGVICLGTREFLFLVRKNRALCPSTYPSISVKSRRQIESIQSYHFNVGYFCCKIIFNVLLILSIHITCTLIILFVYT